MIYNRKALVLTAGLTILLLAGAYVVYTGSLARRSVGMMGQTSIGSSGMMALGLGATSAPAMMDTGSENFARDGKMMFPQPEPTAGQTAAEVDQKIIKNGSLHLVVEKVAKANEDLAVLAKAKGGFVQSSQVSERADGTHYGSVSIRVPVLEFENTMKDAKAMALTVKSETATGQDVTEQYTDLQAQLRNAKAQEEVYLQVLKQAKTVQDILSVQQYLGSIRSQIEQLDGRIKYLENQTSYSTISLTLEEEPSVRVPTKEFRPTSAAKEAVQALVALAQGLVISVIWLAIVGGGIGIPTLLLVWLLIKAIIRIAGGKKTPPPVVRK